MSRLAALRRWLGVPEHAPSWRERGVATLTAALGIAFVIGCSSRLVDAGQVSGLWLVASIGASAVLVFAVPHGPLSQPWAVLAGQGGSALVGVLVAHTLGSGAFAAALAVSGAILLMHSLRCVHPPGGATALSAILAAGNGHLPGWSFILAPVLLNAALLVTSAVVLNAAFPWRRYPLAWAFRAPATTAPAWTAAELEAAFAELDAFVDISDEELQTLLAALQRRRLS